MDSTATLFWGMLFGAIGTGYFVYGKRQQHMPTLICGLLLAVLPYFVGNTVLMVATGLALCATPFLLR